MKTKKRAAWWLLGSAGLVYGIVVVGGLTRLTESGLSITEWKPVTGVLPPLSQAQWETEFNKYKESPEYSILRSTELSIEDFKFLFLMEWSHRIYGRVIGLSFLLPGLYFITRPTKVISRYHKGMIATITGLIGFQGFIGWWMVKSGLDKDDLRDQGGVPRVSQYRLAAHLGTAFVIYSCMIHTGLDLLRENKWRVLKSTDIAQKLNALNSSPLRKYKAATLVLGGLVFTTAISGAIVAGLDAGMIYNEFPYMGESFIPPTEELIEDKYSRRTDKSDTLWRNMLENPVLAQLDHRTLAVSSWVGSLALYLYSRRLKPQLLKEVFTTGHSLFALVTLQASLGISTLIYLVPLPLAAAHQAGSLAVITGAVWAISRMRAPHAYKQQAKSISNYFKPGVRQPSVIRQSMPGLTYHTIARQSQRDSASICQKRTYSSDFQKKYNQMSDPDAGKFVRRMLPAGIIVAVIIAGLSVYIAMEKPKREERRRQAKLESLQPVGKPKIGGPFTLIDVNGRQVTQDTLKGKFALMYFGFTNCPDICPDELDKMALLIEAVDPHQKYMVPVFVTCDPVRDTPAIMRKYLAEFHPSIVGLTGSYEEIKEICKAYRVYFSLPPDLKPNQDYLVDHSIYFYLMDPNGVFTDNYGKDMSVEESSARTVGHIEQFIKDGGELK